MSYYKAGIVLGSAASTWRFAEIDCHEATPASHASGLGSISAHLERHFRTP